MENLIRLALRLLLSATFLLSAYTKAIDFSSFEVRLLDTGLFGWRATPWVAAAFIGLEYLVGLGFLLFSHRIRGLMLLTWGMLIGFTIYLAVLLSTKGNDVNCGCMGETLAFTPLQAIVKNLLSMLLLGLLHYFEGKATIHQASWVWKSALAAMAVVLTAFTIPSLYTAAAAPLESKLYFDASLIEKNGFARLNSDKEPQGKRMYAFLSMSCGHCQLAAERLGSINQRSALPISLVINGDSSELASFIAEHELQQFPATMLAAEPFVQLAGTHLPSLLVVENDSVTHRLKLFNLNGALLEKLLR